MPNRRDFLKNIACTTAGMVVGGRGLADAAIEAFQARDEDCAKAGIAKVADLLK